VHPALALWLWCKNDQPVANWGYKKDRKLRSQLLNYLSDHIRDDAAHRAYALAEAEINEQKQSFDDIFDSCIAYVLRDLWIRNSGVVILLGAPPPAPSKALVTINQVLVSTGGDLDQSAAG
jgi:hypothetical protein